MVACNTISAAKANRLFWLGRYAERAYLNLHLLRRYYDQMIDGDPAIYEDYYHKLDAPYACLDKGYPFLGLVYDVKNPCSLIAGLEAANDNAIVLREEISSEALSYIQMSLNLVRRKAETREKNIESLQPVTDYLLAFWGSVDERVRQDRCRNFLYMGRHLENIDMHLRFDYPLQRIEKSYRSLAECAKAEDGILDRVAHEKLNLLLANRHAYNEFTDDYKTQALRYLNRLVLL